MQPEDRIRMEHMLDVLWKTTQEALPALMKHLESLDLQGK